MSVPSKSEILTLRTDANMTSKEYFLVKANGDNDMDICGAGEIAIGALTNDVADGSSTAKFLPVQVGGVILVKCAGAISAGARAMSDSNGEAVAATDGNNVFGTARETHADNDIGAFYWSPFYLETT